jgi:carboxymethylenebutenolidase
VRLSPLLLSLALLTAPAAAAPTTPPPGEDQAKARLDATPRHGEYADISHGGTPIRTWVSYPERRDRAGVVLLIHEIYGLTDWMRGVADQLAADGFIAVAPDLISGLGPGGGGTDSVASRDDVVKLVRGLAREETRARLDAVRAWAAGLPASNGRVATLGFCWGGSRSFEYAAAAPPPQAAVVFYGSSPDSATLLAVRAPVLGLYGRDDARVNATIEPAQRVLRAVRQPYTPVLYEGAGHGFLRAQALRDGANLRASQQAWPRVLAFLRRHLR